MLTENSSKQYLCYLIASGNSTYVGVTNNFSHRLRQHNGLIKGGAKYTTRKGNDWVPIVHVTGFLSYRSVLQFEWKWKNLTRTIARTSANNIPMTHARGRERGSMQSSLIETSANLRRVNIANTQSREINACPPLSGSADYVSLSLKNRLLALDKLLDLKQVTKKSNPDDFLNLSVKWQSGATYNDMLIFHSKRPCLIKLKLKTD